MNDTTIKIPKMRTIPAAYAEIKNMDPNTSITQYYIRQLILNGDVPAVKSGVKYLVSMDNLFDYLLKNAI